MRGGPVIDLRAYAAASQAFYERTGRLLTIYEYRDMIEGVDTPFTATLLAAEFARENADAQADYDEHREEMSLGGESYDPNETPPQSSRGQKV